MWGWWNIGKRDVPHSHLGHETDVDVAEVLQTNSKLKLSEGLHKGHSFNITYGSSKLCRSHVQYRVKPNPDTSGTEENYEVSLFQGFIFACKKLFSGK